MFDGDLPNIAQMKKDRNRTKKAKIALRLSVLVLEWKLRAALMRDWFRFNLSADQQTHLADNNMSITITTKPDCSITTSTR